MVKPIYTRGLFATKIRYNAWRWGGMDFSVFPDSPCEMYSPSYYPFFTYLLLQVYWYIITIAWENQPAFLFLVSTPPAAPPAEWKRRKKAKIAVRMYSISLRPAAPINPPC
jgi:hypothetical protein